MGTPGDSEKIIQRLKDELREAQEQANTERHKCMELQGNMNLFSFFFFSRQKRVFCANADTKI